MIVTDVDISYPRSMLMRVYVTFEYGDEKCTVQGWHIPDDGRHVTVPELDADSELDELVMERKTRRILAALRS